MSITKKRLNIRELQVYISNKNKSTNKKDDDTKYI